MLGLPATRLTDHVQLAGLLAGAQHCPRLFEARGEGLLSDHVAARPERGRGHRAVRLRNGEIEHELGTVLRGMAERSLEASADSPYCAILSRAASGRRSTMAATSTCSSISGGNQAPEIPPPPPRRNALTRFPPMKNEKRRPAAQLVARDFALARRAERGLAPPPVASGHPLLPGIAVPVPAAGLARSAHRRRKPTRLASGPSVDSSEAAWNPQSQRRGQAPRYQAPADMRR